MYGISKQSTIFKVNNIFNLITFIGLRMPAFILTGTFAIGDRDRLPIYWTAWIVFGSLVLIVINSILLKRLIISDFFTRSQGKVDKPISDQNEDMVSS